MSDQIFLVLVYAWYVKNLVYELLQGFFVQYERLQEMTIFDWYTTVNVA